MSDWPPPNERGKIECGDCHAEFTNPIAFMHHDCYPIPFRFESLKGDNWVHVEGNNFCNLSAWQRFIETEVKRNALDSRPIQK